LDISLQVIARPARASGQTIRRHLMK